MQKLTSRRHIAAVSVCLIPVCIAATVGTARIDPDQYMEHIRYLASPDMKGRATGSPELERAAHYIAGQFRSIGLQPLQGKSYLQPFSVTTNAKLGRGNHFDYSDGGRIHALKFGQEFIPFNFSSKTKVSGAVVFAGYGITAPEYNYDDYAGIDVKDKLALVLRHEPQENEEKSVFAGKVYTEHAQFYSKAVNAKAHGAKGVILINDAPTHSGDGDDLEKFGRAAGPSDAGIAFVQIKYKFARQWISEAGKDLDEIVREIDKDLKPRSIALSASLRIDESIDVGRVIRTAHNVAGYLAGETNEYLAIGAHYDHLGHGEQFSMAPSLAGTVHPGADDNASGAAGVIELARWFSRQPGQKRGILFLAFAGEELGLLGSGYYVNHPYLPADKNIGMINLDMIGRMKDGKLYVGGVGTGEGFKPMLEHVIAKSSLHVDFSDATGYGSSDHTSFTAKQVPVLFFFSGLHGDYHKPSDTWDKIDAPQTLKMLELIGAVSEELIQAPDRPRFVRVKDASPHGGQVAGSGSGYGPYFGSIPDFAEIKTGVRFADVRDGSPAAKAGLRAGDVLIEFAGKRIQNLYDFTYALRAQKPGDEVTVKVLRDGATITAKVLLTRRT